MSDLILALNTGSSSVKYRLIDLGADDTIASGLVERIAPGGHRDAIRQVLDTLAAEGHRERIAAVGHRVVHGGEEFTSATVIDDRVEQRIEALAPLAPLHNPPALAGIRGVREAMPGLPAVAVFDTAFHAQLPESARTYAIDREIARRHGIRRYGFHGISFQYVSRSCADFLGHMPERMIVLHLGNGASAAAIAGGVGVDTSMGFTPLEGLVMGTRGGDLDPGVMVQLLRSGMSLDEVDDMLQRRSGLTGLTGTRDFRDVATAAERDEEQAIRALEVVAHRLRKYVGAYAAVLGGLDALVFTAGIGENSPLIRRDTVHGLGFLGLSVDVARNETVTSRTREISPEDASVPILVVPTDEEQEIARQTAEQLRT